MGKIALGYGSEWHLLRYLGRHRHYLNKEIEKQTGGETIEWCDFKFGSRDNYYDAELKGIEFCSNNLTIVEAWTKFWPQTGNTQNWDAVGRLEINGEKHWLLVEAKSHVEELISECGAKREGGLGQIEKAFKETKSAFGVDDDRDWLKPYYQYCNRLATLHFMRKHSISAKLIFIYFTGDKFENKECPPNESR
jgi:hypothetical protein